MENLDTKLKVEPMRICVDTINQTINPNRNRDLLSSPPVPKKIISPWIDLDKQTYSERDLIKNFELICKHTECIMEKYNTINWNDDIYVILIDIADYIYDCNYYII